MVRRLLDLEARGVSLELADGGRFRVVRAFLTAHRDEAHAIVAYYSHEEHPQ